MICQHPKGRLVSMSFYQRGGEWLYYRRRECPACGAVFSTEERVVSEPPRPGRFTVERLADLTQPLG